MDCIRSVEIDTADGRLRIYARIGSEQNGAVKAELPQREVSAFLPRDILLNGAKSISPNLLKTIGKTLKRLLVGREARVWEYNESSYFGFPSWRSVKID